MTWDTFGELNEDGRSKIKKIGDAHESAVDAICEQYEAQRLASIAPNNPAVRIIRMLKGGQFKGTFTSGALPDRTGIISSKVLEPGGIGIMFDVKSSKTSPGAYGTELHRAHQYRSLLNFAEMGAITGYLIRWYHPDGMNEWRWHWPQDCEIRPTRRKVKGEYKAVELVRVTRLYGLEIPTIQASFVWDSITTPDFLMPVVDYWYRRFHKKEIEAPGQG